MTEPIVIEDGAGGLQRVCVTSARAEGEVYRQGAHVTRWRPRGTERPVLFLSSRAVYARGKAIRGGVPIIFPWFGAHGSDRTKPMHGFARARDWRLGLAEPAPDGTVVIELDLEADETTRPLWPHAFRARYRVTLADTLALALEVVNTSSAAFTFEAALHTYLAVGDIRTVTIRGLEDTAYIDKVDGMRRKRHGAGPLQLTGETDRVFLGTRAGCVVHDPAFHRRLTIDKTGSASTVVWNPWSTKAAEIADLETDDWQRMVCVETANAADDALTLAPGARHVMTATLRVEADA